MRTGNQLQSDLSTQLGGLHLGAPPLRWIHIDEHEMQAELLSRSFTWIAQVGTSKVNPEEVMHITHRLLSLVSQNTRRCSSEMPAP